LELVYENGIVDALINIIINELEYKECLFCFEQKSYTLYVKGEKEWFELSNDKFRNKIFYLQRKLLKKFREENNVDNLDTDREHNIYNKRLMSICIENFGGKIKNIRNEIYRIRKQNINKLVKYLVRLRYYIIVLTPKLYRLSKIDISLLSKEIKRL
jgi:hypothetical protein